MWSCSIDIRKRITIFIKQSSCEGCEFNCSEVLNLLGIRVFVSVRRNSGLSGAELLCLKLHFFCLCIWVATFFLAGVSFARYSLGKATVFVKVFLGLCYIQHYHILTSSCWICDNKCQYHLGKKGKLTVLMQYLFCCWILMELSYLLFCAVLIGYSKYTTFSKVLLFYILYLPRDEMAMLIVWLPLKFSVLISVLSSRYPSFVLLSVFLLDILNLSNQGS